MELNNLVRETVLYLSDCLVLLSNVDNITFFPIGHGNWVDVSRYVASPSKGPAECREAVNNFFVSSAIGA